MILFRLEADWLHCRWWAFIQLKGEDFWQEHKGNTQKFKIWFVTLSYNRSLILHLWQKYVWKAKSYVQIIPFPPVFFQFKYSASLQFPAHCVGHLSLITRPSLILNKQIHFSDPIYTSGTSNFVVLNSEMYAICSLIEERH